MDIIMFFLCIPAAFLLIGVTIGWIFTQADNKIEIEALAAEYQVRADRLWAEAYDRGWMASHVRPFNDPEATNVDLIRIPTMDKVP